MPSLSRKIGNKDFIPCMKRYFELPFAYSKRHLHYRSILYFAVISLLDTLASRNPLCWSKNLVSVSLHCSFAVDIILHGHFLSEARICPQTIFQYYVATYLHKLKHNRSLVPSVKISNHFTVYWGITL